MAVRLREIDGKLVALCAAEYEAEPDDFYIDDAQDHALRQKYLEDYHNEGLIPDEQWESLKSRGQEFLLRCEIQRGGFSSEGTFTIKTSAGGTLVGTANLQYLFDGEKKPLNDGQGRVEFLGTNQAISGFVTCRVIEVLTDGVNVDLPSGETLFISESKLIEKE